MLEDLTDKSISAEVLSIASAGAGMDMGARYEGYIHTKSRDFWILTIEYVDIIRDYNSNHSDYTTVSFLMPLGDFVKAVYPEKDNLEITLINHTVGKVITRRFKLILKNIDPNISSGVYSKESSKKLNEEGMTKIIGECISKTVMELRDMMVYGSYRRCTVKDIISTTLGDIMYRKLPIFENFKRSLDFIPPNNTRVYEHVLVPDSVRPLDLPSFLQHSDYGVYNGGVGTYLQVYNDYETIFVYPLYRQDLSIMYKLKLQIIAVSSMTLGSVDSTYGMKGDLLKILVSSTNASIEDRGEKQLKNKGVSSILTEAESVLKRPFEIDEDKVKVSRDNTKRKMTHKKLSDGSRKKEHHNITTNTYEARSSVLKSDGRLLQVQWNFSNARLLIPGMGLTYMVEEGGKVNLYSGTLQGVHITTDNNSKMEVAILNIFISLKPTKGLVGASKTIDIIANIMEAF